jgi:pro-apoptotic serine protease NMA111
VHLDERTGLVLVDRNTVCIAAGDVIVSFCAFPSEAPAAVRFLHPLHNWAIVSFDVADLPVEVSPLLRGQGLLCVCVTSVRLFFISGCQAFCTVG